MSVELVPVAFGASTEALRKAVNRLIERDRGEHGGRIWLRGDDGVQTNTRGGAVIGTGRRPLIVQSKASGGPHVAVVRSSAGVNDVPTLANSVIMIDDTYLAMGSGLGLRAYDAAGVDYTEITADADGGMVVGGSGSGAGNVTFGGNLVSTGTGKRFLANLSDATLANRFYVQSSTTNGASTLGVIPNGTSTTGAVIVHNAANPAAAAFGSLSATVTDVRVQSGHVGAAYLPLTFYTNNVEAARLDTAGALTLPVAGAKLLADMSSGTLANRFTIQSNVTNGTTAPQLMPNGTATSSQLNWFNSSNLAANSFLNISALASELRFLSSHIGGSYLPMNFYQAGGLTLSILSTGEITVPNVDPPTRTDQVTSESLCKGYAEFSVAAGVLTANEAYNVTSMARSATGVYTVTWNRDFANANYAVGLSYGGAASLFPRITTKAAGSITITVLDTLAAAADVAHLSVIACGTLS